MRYSFRTAHPIAIAVALVVAIPLTSAAPTQSSTSSFPDGQSNQDSTLAQREFAEHEAYSQVFVTPSRSISTLIATPTADVLLETNSRSNLATTNMMVENSCTPDLRGYHIAVLVLLSCTFVVSTFNTVYSLYRQWSFNRRHNRTWPSVNVFSPPDTPKRKSRPLISTLDIEKATLKHKSSTSTLPSISEEPITPARTVSFASPYDSARPPSYFSGEISLPDSPAVGCFPTSPRASSQRSFAEGPLSSFHPLRG